MLERTLSIIKPNAVSRNIIGSIYSRFESAGLKIVAAKMIHLSKEQAEQFYHEHRYRPFFKELIQFMTSGPIMIQVLEGRDAIRRNRELMGATNPQNALAGTLRSDYADSVTENAVHGSDTPENAKKEIAYFFDENEITPK